MTEPMVRFDSVWKQFSRGAAHDSLRDLIPAALRSLTGRQARSSKADRNFWAVRDMSFEVRPGEVLGIIGPNGAGKSTSLKLLNRIMEPTKGLAMVSGKIGALIEVSAGFHQDLTGRQNVFLQGAIMGMRKEEVSRKFDEIVEFAGVEDFIETPVKRYSSGMNARLGFSIAAHLEPDVLIIDEVLAVGDHAFQTKAFARIKAMSKAGAPVVLVSHQLDKVLEICTKAILLDRGRIRLSGTPKQCIDEYLHGQGGTGDTDGLPQTGLTFLDMTVPDGLAVKSGQRISLIVRGSVEKVDECPAHSFALRVVEVASGRHRSLITGKQRGVDLPRQIGPFELHASMTMNLPPGSHIIEVLTLNADTSEELLLGPRVQIEILNSQSFWGDVQLDCDLSQRFV